MELEVQHDENAHKYFALVDGNEALLSYRESGEGVLDLAHTYVPPALRGRGVADELVRGVLDDLRRRGQKVIPSCWFVRLYIDRHAAYQDLLA